MIRRNERALLICAMFVFISAMVAVPYFVEFA
ncbi:MAG: hypothetical protein JWQ77_2290 [Jatrophihabitans sp.]|nr:hypothetical protein [Jatrophihabitans sp.]